MDSGAVQDPFIGQRFGEGGHLEVVGWDGAKTRSNNKLYQVQCKICRQDAELYGDGIFLCAKSVLKAGKTPCGCSKSHHHTKKQHRIMVERFCVTYGFELVDMGEWCRCNTVCTLKCLKDGHEWQTTVGKIKIKQTACNKCRISRIHSYTTKPDDKFVQEFVSTGAFIEGTTFTRNISKKKANYRYLWEVVCPVCSVDEYVVAGLCTGVFDSTSNDLRLGARPCRCASSYKWTEPQWRYRVIKAIKELPEKVDFIGWADGNTRIRTAILKCALHDIWTATTHNIITNKTGCPSCGISGFKKDKPAVVYVIQTAGKFEFTGYGISNVEKERIANHKLSLKKHDCIINQIEIFYTSGEVASSVEQKIKTSFERNAQVIAGFKTEATYVYFYDDVVSFVEEEIYKLEENG